MAKRDRPADTAPVRRQRDNHRLGTRVRIAVHTGRGQHTDGGQGDGAPDKRDASESLSSIDGITGNHRHNRVRPTSAYLYN